MVQLNKEIQLLAMDFDGVIADSILECAVTGYNGYEAYCDRDARIKTPKEIISDKLNKFRTMRPYIRSGEDYIYLFQALSNGVIIGTQEEFDDFQRSYLNRKESYYQLFYSARRMIMTSDYNNWITLNPLYNGMIDFLKSMHSMVHIVSTKASEYIIEILESNGIEFDSKRIHEAGRGYSKTDIISKMMQENHLEPQNMIFIDDHFDTLHKVKSTSVRCLLAGWGYNTDQQRRICHKLNLELVDLQPFYREFKG
jgi:3-deoxy-D-manno-octulosonate 8-phosphate phosphatase KdsC-like HAD superfamily phosphatase